MLQRRPQNGVWFVGLWLAYTIVLVIGTHIPIDPIPHVFNMQDKLIHVGMYGVFSFLAFAAATAMGWIPSGWSESIWASATCIFLGSALFSLVDESTQCFVPGRIVDSYDMLANLLGCLLGTALFAIAGRRIVAAS